MGIMEHLSWKEGHQRFLGYAIYWILGCCTILPWNSFIAANDYFEKLYQGYHIERIFTVCYLPCILLVQGLLTFKSKLLTAQQRINYGLLGFVFSLLFISVVNTVSSKENSQNKFALACTIISSILFGTFGGFLQGAVFEDAATQDILFTQGTVGGTALSGVIISVLRMISKKVGGDGFSGLKYSSLVYFCIAAVTCLIGFVCYLFVVPWVKNKQPYRSLNEMPGNLQDEHREAVDIIVKEGKQSPQVDSGLFSEASPSVKAHHGLETPTKESPRSHKTYQQPVSLETQQLVSPEQRSSYLGDDRPSLTKEKSHDISTMKSQMYLDYYNLPDVSSVIRYCVAMFLVYVVTTSIFPGVLVEDLEYDLMGDWYPLFLILLYNVGDLVGKMAPQNTLALLNTANKNLYASIARALIFIPFYIVIVKLISKQAVVIMITTLLLGVTNGYGTSCILTQASKSGVFNKKQRALVENTLIFSLIFGLTVGAFTGWLWLLL